jgi:hypothetical protein
VIFQDEEAERAGAFWKPAARVLSAGDGDTEAEGREAKPAEELLTVGAILNAWLEEQGYEVGEYAREIGFQRREVEAVCMDRIDPVTLSHDRVAKIIWRPHRDGGLDEDDLDAALGRSFIEDADWALVGAYGSERAYGRTAGLKGSERAEALRSGAAGSTPPLSAEERERRKKAYVREVLAALEEKAGS